VAPPVGEKKDEVYPYRPGKVKKSVAPKGEFGGVYLTKPVKPVIFVGTLFPRPVFPKFKENR
jgi:hypothetical protein